MLKYVLILSLLSVAVNAYIQAYPPTYPPTYPPACPQTCPFNEVYSECGNNGCQNTCANPNIAMVCRAICTPGCICRDGYLRNTKGVCVPACQCDTCKPYEIFDLTRNTECVNTCAEPNKAATCIPNMPRAGCICRPGYLRNDQGACVKPSNCGCGGDLNAFYDACGDNCPITCDNKDKQIACILSCGPGACKCKPGFVRDANGKCILPENCPKKCPGKFEVFACGSACDTTCATLGETCPIVNIKCNEMCYCIDGYARDANGVCIPISQCPPKQCKDDPNAIIAPCGDPCPTTCENKDITGPRVCPAICIVNGCKCKPGYVLGPQGKCILPKYCPTPVPALTCKANEEYVPCPSPCPPEVTCSTYISGIYPLCPSIIPNPADCKPACRCKSGYVRNDKGVCVLPANCCADPNAELVSCPNMCPGGTCSNPTFAPCKIACPRYGCQCKAGYVKISDTNPTCIKQRYCPPTPCTCY